MTLDTSLFLIGLLTEATALTLVIVRQIYKKLPLFSTYLAWSLVNDAGLYLLTRAFPNASLRFYFVSTIIDSVFMFCVFIELSMSVLRPARNILPRWAVFAVGLLFVLSCIVIWPFAKSPGLDHTLAQYQVIVHLQLTFSVIRILYFLLLAACSQLLAIGWRDRELQIATGFGIYALVSLSVAVLHMSQGLGGSPTMDQQYHLLDQVVAASYVLCMTYWAISFAQKVPERREFTPQMQRFLLAVAGNARSTRMALTDTKPGKPVGR